jgi:hypothetical protein
MFRGVLALGFGLAASVSGCNVVFVGIGGAGDESASTWRVQRSSSGGFTGKGGPNIIVTSDGELLVMPGGLGNAPKPGADPAEALCRVKLTSEQFSLVALAVSGAKPAAWGNRRYVDPKNPQGCCDQFFYTLRFERRSAGAAGAGAAGAGGVGAGAGGVDAGKDGGVGGDAGTERGAASWYDDSISRLPADLKALNDALDKVQPEGGHCPM